MKKKIIIINYWTKKKQHRNLLIIFPSQSNFQFSNFPIQFNSIQSNTSTALKGHGDSFIHSLFFMFAGLVAVEHKSKWINAWLSINDFFWLLNGTRREWVRKIKVVVKWGEGREYCLSYIHLSFVGFHLQEIKRKIHKTTNYLLLCSTFFFHIVSNGQCEGWEGKKT